MFPLCLPRDICFLWHTKIAILIYMCNKHQSNVNKFQYLWPSIEDNCLRFMKSKGAWMRERMMTEALENEPF